jgi:hypothetical protein
MRIEYFNRAGIEVNSFDPPASVVRSLTGWMQTASFVSPPVEPTIVTNIQGAVRADRGTVWPTARLCHNGFSTVLSDPRNPACRYFNDDYGTVRHNHRAFRESQFRCDDLIIILLHSISPLLNL